MVFGYNVNLELQSDVSRTGTWRKAAMLLALSGAALLTACTRSDAAAANDAARAQDLLDQRRFAEARVAIKDAIAERDDEPQFHILRGRIEFAANAVPQAFDAYSNAVALDPSNMEALQAVSQLGLQTGHLRESLDATEAILSLAPSDTSALLTRGLHSIIRSRFDEAVECADRILARDPMNEGGAILKARAMFRKGETKAALAALETYSAKRPDTVGIAMTRLEIYRALNDADGMRPQFAKLRNLAPDNDDLRIDEANFAFKEGRASDGVALTIALFVDHNLTREKISTILALWSEYLPTGPSDDQLASIAGSASVPGLTAVADYLILRGRLDAAASLVTKLSGVNRAALDAAIANRRGQKVDALNRADTILAKDETNCLALAVRASARLDSRQLDGALRSAQEAASQCPERTDAWRLAALSYSYRGDLENARRMWRQGMEANRQNSVLAAQYMSWLEANGQVREAVAVARRLTHDAPALMSGWRLYIGVCGRAKDACSIEAHKGLARAARSYGIDLLPGQAPPNGLFGRIVTR